jgi:hypothetical protein
VELFVREVLISSLVICGLFSLLLSSSERSHSGSSFPSSSTFEKFPLGLEFFKNDEVPEAVLLFDELRLKKYY